MYNKAIISFWTKVVVEDVRSKKTLNFLEPNSLRIRKNTSCVERYRNFWSGQNEYCESSDDYGYITRCSLIDISSVKRQSIQRVKAVNSTCLHYQLEEEDLLHMVYQSVSAETF